MNNLNMNEIINYIIKDIKSFMEYSNGEKAVIGISGGKDSSVVAALCVKALGKENVIGVLMPNGTQKDISDSKKLCEVLDIKSIEVNIFNAYNSISSALNENKIQMTKQAQLNLSPRIRMATLYSVAQSINGRVMNTTNACEAFVGYGTLWGDTVGDYAPIKYLTVDEVREIGYILGLPYDLVYKTPADGLTGKSDEEVLGVSYEDISRFYKMYRDYGWKYSLIHMKDQMKKETYDIIVNLYEKSTFKREIINVPAWLDKKYFTRL